MDDAGAVFRRASEIVTSAGLCAASYNSLSDSELLDAQALIARLSAHVQQQAALSAAELARRSERSLGQSGLAARLGHATPGALVQTIMGGSKADAATLLNSGLMLARTQAADDAARLLAEHEMLAAGGDGQAAGRPDFPPVPVEAAIRPWFAPLSDAAAAGRFSLSVAESIRSGLGADARGELSVTAEVAEAICAVLPELIDECTLLTPEQACKASRAARNRADAAGVLARSEEQRRQQYVKIWTKPDGMVGGSFLLDPENGALVAAIHGQIRHPRRAGVKFRSPDEIAAERAAAGDLREIDEYTADAFVELLRAGATVDPEKMLDRQLPAVRVHVQGGSLTRAARRSDGSTAGGTGTGTGAGIGTGSAAGSGLGFGIIERSNEAVPIETVQRLICDSGTVSVTIDENNDPLNVGREQRLFTRAQRIALAARDGGCMMPGCDRPVSWTEAHHIKHWLRDHGPTNINDGMLFCRRCHLRIHNQGWEIHRDENGYWITPPASVDPTRTARPLRSKSGLAPKPRPPVRLPAHLAAPRPARTHPAQAPPPHRERTPREQVHPAPVRFSRN